MPHRRQARTGFARRQHVVRGHQNRDALVRQARGQTGQRGLVGASTPVNGSSSSREGPAAGHALKNPLALTTRKAPQWKHPAGAEHRYAPSPKDLHPIPLRRAGRTNLTHAAGHHRILGRSAENPTGTECFCGTCNQYAHRPQAIHPTPEPGRTPGESDPKNGAQQRGLTGTISTNQTRKLATLRVRTP